MNGLGWGTKQICAAKYDVQYLYSVSSYKRDIWFVSLLGWTSLLNIWGHIATVPAGSSGTLTNVLPHRNAIPQTKDMTPHPVTVFRHRADLSLSYPLMWNVTLEYTTTNINVLGQTRSGNPSPTFHTHTHQRTLNFMIGCGVRIHYAIRSATAASREISKDSKPWYVDKSFPLKRLPCAVYLTGYPEKRSELF